MILLVNNEKNALNILYIKSSYVVIEQIDKQLETMQYSIFVIGNSEILLNTYQFKLSFKSRKLIEGLDSLKSFKFSQNQFYDILTEGFNDFSELINPELVC